MEGNPTSERRKELYFGSVVGVALRGHPSVVRENPYEFLLYSRYRFRPRKMYLISVAASVKARAIPPEFRGIPNAVEAAPDLRRHARELRADSKQLKLRSTAINKAADALAIRVVELSLELDRSAAQADLLLVAD